MFPCRVFQPFEMKLVLFTLLLVAIGAFALEDSEEEENISEDAKPLRSRRPEYTAQGFKINYNLACSNAPNCYCQRVCVPWNPCNCACPPVCPPAPTTTTFQPPAQEVPRCVNGAPDAHYPDCCFNGGRGKFCCLNGANNLHCCLNGANNPWCSLPTEPPVQAPPGGNDDCNRCQPCQPCIPWTPCQPCHQPCQQRCFGRK